MAHITRRTTADCKPRWDVRWNALGRWQTKTFTRRQDADAFRRKVEGDELRGMVVDVRWPAIQPSQVRRWCATDRSDGTVVSAPKNNSARWTTLRPFVIDELSRHLDTYAQAG